MNEFCIRFWIVRLERSLNTTARKASRPTGWTAMHWTA